MAAHILALTHGLLGFKLACVIFLVPMLVGLIRQRASLRHFLLWPLVAAPVMLIALLIFALLFHWLPGADTAMVGILRILVALMLFPFFGYCCGAAASHFTTTTLTKHQQPTYFSP